MKRKDLVGMKFGRLQVIRFDFITAKFHCYWICKCDCGVEKSIAGRHLKSDIVSCGCYVAELNRSRLSTHGLTKTLTYKSWQAMRTRCLNAGTKSFERYGARGIKICPQWSSFENFLLDMGPRTSRSYSIERIDNEGDYRPENCRWATKREQSNNTSANKFIDFQGERLTWSMWETRLRFSRGLIARRIAMGFSEERALTQPVQAKTTRRLVVAPKG